MKKLYLIAILIITIATSSGAVPNDYWNFLDHLPKMNGWNGMDNLKYGIFSFILKHHPSMTRSEIDSMSAPDLEKLIYEDFRTDGAERQEAKNKAHFLIQQALL